MKTFSTMPSSGEKMKKIGCPLCGSSEVLKLWDLEKYSFSKCPVCSLVYQNPQPIALDVENRYDDTYFNYEIENEETFLNLMLLGLKDIGFIPRVNLDENVKVLDIGCATGLFLDHMKGLGWDTYGVEVCSSAAEYGNRVRNLNIFTGTLAQADFPDNMFDVVHLSHVIEHINDPNSFLENIVRVLKPGGVLYCVTPNISGLQSHIFKERWRSVIPDHMILYSVKTLKQLLVKHGLIYKKHKTWGGMCAGSGYPESIKKFLDRTAKIVGFGDVVITKSIKPTN